MKGIDSLNKLEIIKVPIASREYTNNGSWLRVRSGPLWSSTAATSMGSLVVSLRDASVVVASATA